MEGFIEQVVKRDKTAKSLAIKIISIALLFIIPLTFVFLARFMFSAKLSTRIPKRRTTEILRILPAATISDSLTGRI